DALPEISEVLGRRHHLEDRRLVSTRGRLEAQESGVRIGNELPTPVGEVRPKVGDTNRLDAWIDPAPGVHRGSPVLIRRMMPWRAPVEKMLARGTRTRTERLFMVGPLPFNDSQ